MAEPAYLIIQASANAREFLNLDDDVLGRYVGQLPGDLAERIRPLLDEPLHVMPVAVRCHIGVPSIAYDSLLHRSPDGGLIIELERAAPSIDLSQGVNRALNIIVGASTLKSLCDEAASVFEELTGYDRVMVYRFDDEGHGEVYSEQCKPELEPYLGIHYPSSDIPQVARRLYERNRVRMLVDVGYAPVPLTPRLSPLSGRDLDMSLCCLRGPSPIHVQYLKNMGVCATLVVSLIVSGRLWGLIYCHHYVPRFIQYECRAVCELLAEAIATRIAALESFVQAQSELVVRRLEQRMIEAISRDGDWKGVLFDESQSLLQPVGAAGAALLYEGEMFVTGEVPGTKQIREIVTWLDKKPRAQITATMSLGVQEEKFAALRAVTSGLLVAPVSTSPGEYLLWFRPEQVRTVTWGGDPSKPMSIGNDPLELSPRRSFAQWHQIVEGTSEPWTPADLATARLIADTVTDVLVQFRSVQMLIAQTQLESVSRQVQISEQPVVITEADGRILLTNEAFERLLPAAHPHLERLDDLPQFSSEPVYLRTRAADAQLNPYPAAAK